jgi:hypothetical protein
MLAPPRVGDRVAIPWGLDEVEGRGHRRKTAPGSACT